MVIDWVGGGRATYDIQGRWDFFKTMDGVRLVCSEEILINLHTHEHIHTYIHAHTHHIYIKLARLLE